MQTTKSYVISKQVVLEAYRRVRASQGAAGVDEESIAKFEENLKKNLYKIWNRMSSGSYFPPPVRVVEIPKASGKTRELGIPTVSDRIAQMVAKMYLEPQVEPIFHEDSYGYRPNKSAIQAIGKARERCWRFPWVLDVDIKGFFDNIDHTLMMKAVRHHAKEKWIPLYIERWLKAKAQGKDGTLRERDKGTPQGGVISPLLANLFLHYAFDEWMRRNYPHIPWEHYADDIVVHCRTQMEANHLREALTQRLKECKLELNEEKTKIVFCKGGRRQGNYPHEKFDFLGYTFRPRLFRSRGGIHFVGFYPAVSNQAKKLLLEKMRHFRIQRRSPASLEDLAKLINPTLRGWIEYFDKYHKRAIVSTVNKVNDMLARWARHKYKRFRTAQWSAWRWLRAIAEWEPGLFVHWQMGIKPTMKAIRAV